MVLSACGTINLSPKTGFADTMTRHNTDTAVIGAGIAGIAAAYYLSAQNKKCDVIIVDPLQAMSFTSAHSGENYRNWWPHPAMVEFTNHSIELMEQIARDTDNCLQMSRRGYALATRQDKIDELIADLYDGYAENAEAMIRVHESASANLYQPPLSADWQRRSLNPRLWSTPARSICPARHTGRSSPPLVWR